MADLSVQGLAEAFVKQTEVAVYKAIIPHIRKYPGPHLPANVCL